MILLICLSLSTCLEQLEIYCRTNFPAVLFIWIRFTRISRGALLIMPFLLHGRLLEWLASKSAVPKLFGLRTPFAVKYFSQTPWRSGQYKRYLGISLLLLRSLQLKVEKHCFRNGVFSSK